MTLHQPHRQQSTHPQPETMQTDTAQQAPTQQEPTQLEALQADNMQVNSGPQLPALAIAALSRGRKLEAIKIVHQQTGLGLKDSKELIEAYELQHPQLSAHSAPVGITAAKSRHSITVGILVLLLVALMLALMFF
jgi:ribosomal protein L7/L12